jgi:hypothetical protein
MSRKATGTVQWFAPDANKGEERGHYAVRITCPADGSRPWVHLDPSIDLEAARVEGLKLTKKARAERSSFKDFVSKSVGEVERIEQLRKLKPMQEWPWWGGIYCVRTGDVVRVQWVPRIARVMRALDSTLPEVFYLVAAKRCSELEAAPLLKSIIGARVHHNWFEPSFEVFALIEACKK